MTTVTRPYRPRKKDVVSQELLDLNQAADSMGVSRRFIELEIERGRLRKILLSPRIARISKRELERYAEAQTVDNEVRQGAGGLKE